MKNFVKELKKYGFELEVNMSCLNLLGFRHVVFIKEDNDFIYNININIDRNEITFWKMHKNIKHIDYGRAIACSVDYKLMKLVTDNFETLKNKIEGLIKNV